MNKIEIILVYQDSEYSMEIEDPTKSVAETVKEIVEALQLAWTDGGGNPITYHLGRDIGREPEILKPKVKGKDQTLYDYNIRNDDKLILIKEVIAG